ncbi:sperm-associated acrosin inhibitor-like [Saccopteryx leptura]|uniref:sperm-associated acrosin inhibitor-like n=1 Tax=Saccopteryx leptura TaxID=249018 RepID=UPI00339CE81C
MSFFSLLIKSIFITALVFPLYSETGFSRSKRRQRKEPVCDFSKKDIYTCTREYDPVCATNGQSYSNPCVFCIKVMEHGGTFSFKHYGRC